MINITTEHNIVRAAALGEFTIADFHELEERVLQEINTQGVMNLQIDLRDMLNFTIDVAWEELRFSRVHAHDFNKIAIITTSQWISWSAWLNLLFIDADLMVFDTAEPAEIWLKQT